MNKTMGLLLSGLFLCGCGTGAGTTASSNGTIPGEVSQAGPSTQSGPAKVFTLKIVDSGKVAAKTVPGATLPLATDVRVVISRYGTATTMVQDYDDSENPVGVPHPVTSYTQVYKDVQDVPYSATGSVNVGIPEGTGYTFDVVTSKLESGNHSILKYGQGKGITVGPNNTSATITIVDLNTILNMTVADTVTSKMNFDVTLDNALPLDPSYKMTMSFGTIGSAPSVIVNSIATKCTFLAPTSYSSGTVYLQGQFTLNKLFLNQGETQAQWTRTFPNAAYGEEVSSQLSPLYAVAVPIF